MIPVFAPLSRQISVTDAICLTLGFPAVSLAVFFFASPALSNVLIGYQEQFAEFGAKLPYISDLFLKLGRPSQLLYMAVVLVAFLMSLKLKSWRTRIAISLSLIIAALFTAYYATVAVFYPFLELQNVAP